MVRDELRQVANLSRAVSIEAEDGLKRFGLDSLMALELRNRLAGMASVTLPATLIFDHPTPLAVAKLVLARMQLPEAGVEDGVAPRGLDLRGQLAWALERLSPEALASTGLLQRLVAVAAGDEDGIHVGAYDHDTQPSVDDLNAELSALLGSEA